MSYKLIFNLFFLLFVFISKEFIVFNEEVLVLFSFFIFIFLVIRFARILINELLSLKTKTIKDEFDFFKNLQKQTISYLKNYHEKQILLAKNQKKILEFAKNEIKIVHICFNFFWYNKIKLNFEEKLKKLVNCETQKNLFIQNFYLLNLSNFFLNKFISLASFKNLNKKIKKNIVIKNLNILKSL